MLGDLQSNKIPNVAIDEIRSSYATTGSERQDRTRVIRVLQINGLCLSLSLSNMFLDQEFCNLLSVVVCLVNQPERLPYDVGLSRACTSDVGLSLFHRDRAALKRFHAVPVCRLSGSRTSVIIIPNPDKDEVLVANLTSSTFSNHSVRPCRLFVDEGGQKRRFLSVSHSNPLNRHGGR
jgi:hypothetical protein